jgi:putative ABC transport system permease protein
LISPLSSEFSMTSINVRGHEPGNISVNSVGPDYFRTLETPLIAGRAFTDRDEKVVIVNEKTAAHFWPHENPLGKRVSLGRQSSGEYEVVGVVKNVRSESLREDAPATVYTPFRVNQRPHMTLHVRVSGQTAPVIAALIAEIRTLDANVPVYNASTMAGQIDRTLALDRLMALLTALFGVLAVAIAAIGLYGVMAFMVAARTREIGIRMALGATQARVLRHVLVESAALVFIGVAVGVPAALGASRVIRSFLYGLSPTDPWTYAALAAVFAAIALSATLIPARRAAGVDPMVALRYE